MKKFWLFALLGLASSLWAADNQVRQNYGTYIPTQTPTEATVTVSSSAYTTLSAVNNGQIRYMQNVGSTNIGFFYVLASSKTVTNKYLTSGTIYIEDEYFGAIYFLVPAGTASSSLSYTTILTK